MTHSTNYNHPQSDTAVIEKKIDNLQATLEVQKWWENDLVQGLTILSALLGIVAFIPGNTTWRPWLIGGALILLIIAGIKIFWNRNNKTLIFIPNEMQSFWSHAPQPDGRKLTQIGLSGIVTNTSSNQLLYLADIKLLSPRTKRTHSKFIDTVHHNRVDDKDRPIFAGERREFSGHFFVDGFIGTPRKPLTLVILITDNLGNSYKVKFPKLSRAEDR